MKIRKSLNPPWIHEIRQKERKSDQFWKREQEQEDHHTDHDGEHELLTETFLKKNNRWVAGGTSCLRLQYDTGYLDYLLILVFSPAITSSWSSGGWFPRQDSWLLKINGFFPDWILVSGYPSIKLFIFHHVHVVLPIHMMVVAAASLGFIISPIFGFCTTTRESRDDSRMSNLRHYLKQKEVNCNMQQHDHKSCLFLIPAERRGFWSKKVQQVILLPECLDRIGMKITSVQHLIKHLRHLISNSCRQFIFRGKRMLIIGGE